METTAVKENKIRFEANTSSFSKIPGSPVAYWVSSNFCNNYLKGKIGDVSEVITGMTIGNNNLYLRLWHEICNININFNKNSMDEIDVNLNRWIPYSKGGGRRNWYGNYEYVVNWKEKNNFNRSKTTLQHLYLKEGVTWPFITTSNFSARYLPTGFLWDVAGSPCFFNNTDDLKFILAFMASKVADYILSVVNPTINVQAIDVSQLPLILVDDIRITNNANENVSLSKSDWDSFETSWDFKKHPLI